MIDLHAHVLAGIDDGPATVEDGVRLVAEAARRGIRTIAATPHVSSRYPTSAAAMQKALSALREAVESARVDVQLLPGGELALESLQELSIAEVRAFALGGNPGYVLVEFPYDAWPASLAVEIVRLRESGIRTVLAHPERNPDVQARPARLEGLVAAGVLVQVTAGAVTGQLGASSRKTVKTLLEFGLVHMLASDAHGFTGREPSLDAATAALKDPGLARWLTVEVPRAVVEDDTLPEFTRPQRRAFRPSLRLRR